MRAYRISGKIYVGLKLVLIIIVLQGAGKNEAWGQTYVCGEIWYTSQNPEELAKLVYNSRKNNTQCDIEKFLYVNGYTKSYGEGCGTFIPSSFSLESLVSGTAQYPNLFFAAKYRNQLMSAIKKDNRPNFGDYRLSTLIAAIDSLHIYSDSLKVPGAANLHIEAKVSGSEKYYELMLSQLLDEARANTDEFYFNTRSPKRPKDKKISYDKIYRLAQEIIFINDPELNNLFWEAFECEREIPVVFYNNCEKSGLRDEGVVSLAYIFGSALADYLFDPLLYTHIANPYSVALVRGKPFDEKVYNEYIQIFQKYIKYLSCEDIKVPFLIKFDKTPENGKGYNYNSYPFTEEYHSLPDTCSDYGVKDFPLNFSIYSPISKLKKANK